MLLMPRRPRAKRARQNPLHLPWLEAIPDRRPLAVQGQAAAPTQPRALSCQRWIGVVEDAHGRAVAAQVHAARRVLVLLLVQRL